MYLLVKLCLRLTSIGCGVVDEMFGDLSCRGRRVGKKGDWCCSDVVLFFLNLSGFSDRSITGGLVIDVFVQFKYVSSLFPSSQSPNDE